MNWIGIKTKRKINGITTHIAMGKDDDGYQIQFKRFMKDDEEDFDNVIGMIMLKRGNVRIMITTLSLSHQSMAAVILLYKKINY